MIKIAGIDPSINSTGIVIFTLNDKFEIIDNYYHGFTDVNKNVMKNKKFEIEYYSGKNFDNHISRNLYISKRIANIVSECKYVAFEGYSYGSMGKYFDIGECIGAIKSECYTSGKIIKIFEPTIIKKFATGKGNANKIIMYNEFIKSDKEINVDLLPQIRGSSKNVVIPSPTSDIIDAYYIAKLLILDLKSINKHIQIDDLKKELSTFKSKDIDRLLSHKFIQIQTDIPSEFVEIVNNNFFELIKP